MPAPIHVVPYDARWAERFVAEREQLERVLAPWLHGSIEHVGSTAVPGLAAKPVIDIMAPVVDLESSRPAIEALKPLHYLHFPYREDVMHWHCKPSDETRTHHLHLVPFGSALWHERLRFRDRLRADPRVAAEYAALKLALARQHEHDREATPTRKGRSFAACSTSNARPRRDSTPRPAAPCAVRDSRRTTPRSTGPRSPARPARATPARAARSYEGRTSRRGGLASAW